MKIKQKLLFLLPLLFLFTPLFSSAQFITTNAPCEPEIIPPLSQAEAIYCPYCANKGEYLHLKWDLKANFQDPVCIINCWTPTGLQCSGWPTNRLFDEKGRLKNNLKPKDDVFIKDPPRDTRSATPGINLQVSCYDRNDPSKRQTGGGIRIYNDNACGEPAVGEPCEIPFKEIEDSLLLLKRTLITESSFRDWLTFYRNYYDNDSAPDGSGGAEEISDFISTEEFFEDPSGHSNYFGKLFIDGILRAEEEDGLDPGLCDIDNDKLRSFALKYSSEAIEATFYFSSVRDYLEKGEIFPVQKLSLSGESNDNLVIVSAGKRRSSFVGKEGSVVFYENMEALSFDRKPSTGQIFDCIPLGLISPNRTRASVGLCFSGMSVIDILNMVRREDFCPESFKNVEVFVLYTNINKNQLDLMIKNKILRSSGTLNWLKDNYLVSGDLGGLGASRNYGVFKFNILVTYLGDFVGHDYHPNVINLVGQDCDEYHRPLYMQENLIKSKTLKSSQLGSLNWLANAWMAWENLLKLK